MPTPPLGVLGGTCKPGDHRAHNQHPPRMPQNRTMTRNASTGFFVYARRHDPISHSPPRPTPPSTSRNYAKHPHMERRALQDSG